MGLSHVVRDISRLHASTAASYVVLGIGGRVSSQQLDLETPSSASEADDGSCRLHHRDTKRLVLRRFRPQDLDSFVAYRSDPEIARYQNWEVPYRPHQARQFLHELQAIHPNTPANGSSPPWPCATPIG